MPGVKKKTVEHYQNTVNQLDFNLKKILKIVEQSQNVNNKIVDQGIISVDENFSQEDLSG